MKIIFHVKKDIGLTTYSHMTENFIEGWFFNKVRLKEPISIDDL